MMKPSTFIILWICAVIVGILGGVFAANIVVPP